MVCFPTLFCTRQPNCRSRATIATSLARFVSSLPVQPLLKWVRGAISALTPSASRPVRCSRLTPSDAHGTSHRMLTTHPIECSRPTPSDAHDIYRRMLTTHPVECSCPTPSDAHDIHRRALMDHLPIWMLTTYLAGYQMTIAMLKHIYKHRYTYLCYGWRVGFANSKCITHPR